MRILVLGYYNRHNLGDDAYVHAIPLIFKQNVNDDTSCHDVTFLSVDSAKSPVPANAYDVALCGGGNVIAPYFLDKFRSILRNFAGPRYLFGVSTSYPSFFDKGAVDDFDRVFLRDCRDLRVVERRLGTCYAHYMPDPAFILPPVRVVRQRGDDGDPWAAVSLIQSINRDAGSCAVLDKLADCIRYVCKTHRARLLRFDSSNSKSGDDSFINEAMVNRLGDLVRSGRVVVDNECCNGNPQRMLAKIGACDVCVCMRFHSHVFSIVQQVPFVSLCLTRKVEMLMDEMGDYGRRFTLRLPFDGDTLQPTDVDCDAFQATFDNLLADRQGAMHHLQRQLRRRVRLLQSGVYTRIVERADARPCSTSKQQRTERSNDVLLDQLHGNAEQWWAQHSQCPQRDVNELTPAQAAAHFESVETMCSLLCFDLTGAPQSRYVWGFSRDIRRDPSKLRDCLAWIVDDWTKKSSESSECDRRRLHLDFVRQTDFDGSHRAGWTFAMDHLRALHADTGVLFDACIDRTFHWARETLAARGVVPYTQSWIGVLHHTPLEDYTRYNATALVANPLFQQSLATCKGLFTLSESLRDWLLGALQAIGVHDVRVEHVAHPTAFPRRRWSVRRFLRNRNKRLVQVGAWMRETFALYEMAAIDQAQVSEHVAVGANARSTNNKRRRSRRLSTKRIVKKRRLISGPVAQAKSIVSSTVPLEQHVDEEQQITGARKPWSQRFKQWIVSPLHRNNRADAVRRSETGETDAVAALAVDCDTFDADDHVQDEDCVRECVQSNESILSERRPPPPSAIYCRGRWRSLQKSVLQGSNMNHYLKPDCLRIEACDAENVECHADACRDCAASTTDSDRNDNLQRLQRTNKWACGLHNYVDRLSGNIDVLDRVSNRDYDRLLAENIVFLHLLDASACNTLIECVVRGTPILINRLPGVEEVLGRDYPLYYDSLEEAVAKSRDFAAVERAHVWLKNRVDTERFRVESFVDAVVNSQIYQDC